MEMIYTDNTLYINVEERINFTTISRFQRKLYSVIDSYSIPNIVINILSNEHYDHTLLNDLINDYQSKYNGILIIK